MNPSDVTRISHLIEFQAQRYPENTALIDAQGVELSWADYRAGVLEASELLVKRGVGNADRVLIGAENCIPAVMFVFAASKLGVW